MMTPLRLAWLHLTRKGVATLMTLLSIAVSVAASGVLVRLSLLSSSRFESMARGGDAVVGAKAGGIEILLGALNLEGPYPSYVPYKLFLSLESGVPVRFEDGAQSNTNVVRSIIPIVQFAKFKNYRVIGTNEKFLKRPDPEDTLVLSSGSWFSQAGEAVLGAQVAGSEGVKVGDSISIATWDGSQNGSPESVRVVGILMPTRTAWDRAAYTNLDQARKSLAHTGASATIWGMDVLHYYLVYLQPGGFVSLQSLINNRTVAQVVPVKEEIQKLEELTGTGKTLGFFMTVLIIGLGALCLAAMMMSRFEALSIQLAVMRALGFRKTQVGAWVVWEGLILGGSACLLGAALDSILFPWLRHLMGQALPPPEVAVIPLYFSAPVWLAAIGATVLGSFIPLWRLYHQDVHFALKGI